MNVLRKLVATATAAAAVAGTLVLSVQPARAASYYASTIVPGNNVRACASTADPCQVLTTTTSTGRMQCWRDGGWANGRYNSNRWFLMELSNGQEGFVHSSFVTNQTSVPNCNALPRVLAADFALDQVKSKDSLAPAAYGPMCTAWPALTRSSREWV